MKYVDFGIKWSHPLVGWHGWVRTQYATYLSPFDSYNPARPWLWAYGFARTLEATAKETHEMPEV